MRFLVHIMDEVVPGLRLVFTLPPALLLLAQPGRHQPCLFGCRLDVATDGEVTVQGRDRITIFHQAQRFLTPLVRHSPPTTILATLFTPARQGPNGEAWPGGADSYSIIIKASIAIVATAVPVVTL